MRLVLERGDLTKAKVDAIVNAANSGMLGGGGVDGAIHRAAGPELVRACRQVKRVEGMRCPPGQARITPGFRLPAAFVIHTVGPIYARDPDPPATLRAAHLSSLKLANEALLKSVAFPAISCGVFGYPHDEAAEIALKAVVDGCGQLEEVRFVLFGPATHGAWVRAARRLGLDFEEVEEA